VNAVNAFVAKTIKWFLIVAGLATCLTLPFALDINLFGQNRFAVAAAWQSLVPTHSTAFLRGPIATSWRRCLLQRCHVAKEPPP